MSITKAITANAYKNNSATVVYGGNVPSNSTVVTNAPGLTVVGFRGGKVGSSVPEAHTDANIAGGTYRRGTYKPYSAGNYGLQVAGQYVMMGQSTHLAGVANTTLQSCANNGFRIGVKRVRGIRTSWTSAWSWTAPSGTNAHGENTLKVTYTATKATHNYSNDGTVGNTNEFGSDAEAAPTRAVPGEFTYAEGKGGGLPTQRDYPAVVG